MANSVETLSGPPGAAAGVARAGAGARRCCASRRRKPLGAIGGVIVLGLLVMAVFAGQIAPHSYEQSVPATA